MTIGKFLFTYRRYLPIPFFIAGVVLANPRQDLVIFGALVMALGEILRLAAFSFSDSALRDKEIVTKELCTNGPFAYLRNPVYLGNILLYMGASILSGAWLPYLLYVAFIFFSITYALCIRYEEYHLLVTFGKPYEMYMNAVPRFFPRLSAYPDRGNKKADIKAAFDSESSTLLTITIFLVLVMIKWFLMI